MAIPHLHVMMVSWSKNHTLSGGAAYRAAEAIYSEHDKKMHDYTRKTGVVYKEVMAPDEAPDWMRDRSKLWPAIENMEKRKDAQLARSFDIALPRELSREQNKALIREYIAENFVKWGMVADLTIHESKASDGKLNPHCHILVGLREVNKDGFGKKNRDWNHKSFIKRWREDWQDHANRHLAKAGFSERIDMRSYEEQGEDKEPTDHMGKHANTLEEKGIETLMGANNRMVKHRNRLRQMAKERKQLAERELFDELEIYSDVNPSIRNLRDAANNASGDSGSTLRDVANYRSGSGGSQHKRPDGQALPYFMQHSRARYDPAMQEGIQRHQEALQRAYGHRHIGAIMRATIRNRVTQWKSKVREHSQDIFSHFAKLWKHSRDAHGHMRKEKDRGYER